MHKINNIMFLLLMYLELIVHVAHYCLTNNILLNIGSGLLLWSFYTHISMYVEFIYTLSVFCMDLYIKNVKKSF